MIFCGCCHDQLRSTTFYEPPHDTVHRQTDPWQVVLAPLAPPVRPERNDHRPGWADEDTHDESSSGERRRHGGAK